MYYDVIEELTRSFYEWEHRGRGWDVWDYPVELEPPFVPFYFHSIQKTNHIDDGYKQTFMSSVIEKVKRKWNKFSDEHIKLDDKFPEPSEYVSATQFQCDEKIEELIVVFPQNYKVNSEYIEQCLLGITTSTYPVSFEIIGSEKSITVQFACRESDSLYISQQIHAFFPDAIITVGQNLLQSLLAETKEIAVVDFGLSEEFMRPLRTFKTFDPDPLTSVFGVLENLNEGEKGIIQILFQVVDSPWTTSIMRSVLNDDGDSFFIDAPEMVKLAKEKCKHPLFAVIIRIAATTKSQQRAWEILKALTGCFTVFSDPYSNELIPLTNQDYENEQHLADIIMRQSHRSGMILNSAELISFVHFPSETIVSKKLTRQIQKTIETPSVVIGNKFVLGENVHNNKKTVVSLNYEQRLRHMHIIGSTGTGKSTLLLNLITQDIQSGLGIAVLDPHGDLIESILERVPENRHEDVILFDPGDEEYPVGFNILEAKTKVEKNVLSSDLVEIFRRFSTSWGDQMSVVLGNAISAFLESNRVGSLTDLRRFLIEKGFRETFLQEVTDEHIKYFWDKEFSLLRGSALNSILTRLDFFLRPKTIRNIVSQQRGIDIEDIVNHKKIFLVKLAQGIIGDENAYLLGSLLVSKLHQVVMQRQLLSHHERTPFYLYIDEFQNFITASMKAIMSGARKYSLGLILAHQDLHQLWELDVALANSILSNAGTRICFRIGDFDAQKLQSGFAHFDINDLQSLSIGEAIVRVERSDCDFNLRTFLPSEINIHYGQQNKEKIIGLSRKKYGIAPVAVDKKQEASETFHQPPYPKQKETTTKKIVVNANLDVLDDDNRRMNGKNVSQHRFLQTLIKRLAEQRGYKATIEEATNDKLGRVDVGLERDGEKIACEISVTTNDDHEIKNIEKCFQSGYGKVLFCSTEKKRLEAMKKLITEKLELKFSSNVFLFLPDEIILFFENETTNEIKLQSENILKGYRVKVEYKTISESQKKEKQEVVSGVVVNALRRLKGDR